MKAWNIDTTNPDLLWKEADKDGKGMVLFDEFVQWAIKKNLDLDNDDNLDFEDQNKVDRIYEEKLAN